MIQEHKDILLKDLCARLPYGVKCEVIKLRIDGEMVYIRSGSSALELTINNIKELATDNLYEIKPYLLPISSMTEEQKTSHNFLKYSAYANPIKLVDFYNKHHFDYRGLIPMGLANDATGLNIY